MAALTQGFLLTDKQYLSRANQLGYDDGSTAVLLMMNKGHIFVGNVGDSRAVLVKADSKAIPLSFDHKPNRPDEKKRITDLGGQVCFQAFACTGICMSTRVFERTENHEWITLHR